MLGLRHGVVPVLHAPALLEQGIAVAGHVAGGVDIRHAGLEIVIDHNAVADFDPVSATGSVTGRTPMPATRRSQGSDRLPASATDRTLPLPSTPASRARFSKRTPRCS